MRIQIIGAGLAGCAVAAGLKDKGHEIGLYDANKQYGAWAICQGKIFAPKSEGNLAKRLMDGYDLYADPNSLPQFDDFSFLNMLHDECVTSAKEWCFYKNPKQTIKKLNALKTGNCFSLEDGVIVSKGYRFNAAKAVALTRAAFPEHIDNPELIINCKGAWQRDGDEKTIMQVTPVRGVTVEINLNNVPEDGLIFHWPAAGMYYVPSDSPGKYQYGTVLVPDKSFEGVKPADLARLMTTDNAYIMADWVRALGVNVSMTGAAGTASAGYRPWLRGKVPGYFVPLQVRRTDNALLREELWVNGLYQSGAQLFFWLARMVAEYVKHDAVWNITDLNMETRG